MISLRSVSYCLVLLLLSSSLSLAAALQTYTIDMRHRLADELVPILQPLVAPGGAVTAYNNVLIIKTTAKNFQQLQQTVKKLDTPIRQLLISVSTDSSVIYAERGIDADIDVRVGDVTIRTGDRHSPHDQVVIHHGTQRRKDQGVQQVSAIEGQAAFIQVGQEVPVHERTQWPGHIEQRSSYKKVNQGFYATVRLSGTDLATIQLEAQNNRLARNNSGNIDINSTSTVVQAPIGQWVAVGGVNTQASQQNSDINKRVYRTRNQQAQFYIKVDLQ
ncbi:secretin N-terminal domain-containing protein [Zooshikella sp. RANM57]|uniref:secretin N-terminal domain-containing protein n=1 Tax=Zooshikella sp. RANM57 TaxID=3425863 RepID=UPI003D6DB48C